MSQLTIRVKKSGPYLIAVEEAGEVRIVDHDGNELVPTEGRAIALCRCGGSSTKPFCDGTHKRNGFLQTTDPSSIQAPESSGTPSDSSLRSGQALRPPTSDIE